MAIKKWRSQFRKSLLFVKSVQSGRIHLSVLGSIAIISSRQKKYPEMKEEGAVECEASENKQTVQICEQETKDKLCKLPEPEVKEEMNDSESDLCEDMAHKLDLKNPDNQNNMANEAIEDPEELALLKEIAKKPLEAFKTMKDISDIVAKIFYKDITRRWKESEARIKETEDLLSSVKCEGRSLEEDRVEILGELLDKAAQSFEIYEEHEDRKIPYGHRCVLEARLLIVFNNAIDLIHKIIGEFDKLKGDSVGVNDERDQLRYEIRYCDAVYTEVHEHFLKSYLGMEW